MTLHIELLNLARDSDRLALMRGELAKAGLDARTTPGLDYRTAGTGDLEKYCKPEGPWGTFHLQNMACTISHMRAWERFIASDATHCLVLEDDVFIAPDLGAWLADLSWWPQGADMIKVERWQSPRLKVLLERHSEHRGRAISRLLSRHVGAAGYVMTRQAAQKAIDARPYDITIDNLLFNANASRLSRSMVIYQVHPAMVQQGNEPPKLEKRVEKRLRPTGWALVRQKVKRGYYEVVYPLSSLVKLATGRAKLQYVTYAEDVR